MSGGRASRVDHVALCVCRLAWHVALFEQVFGMTLEADEPGEPHQVWLEGGIQLIECREEPPTGGALAHVAIAVADPSEAGGALARWGCRQLERGPLWWSLSPDLVVELVDAGP
ncbi:MAG: VOC family protein [Actinomycetota bacterium]|nr:VOC family protein [Actinomycetota bacterium]